jgi:glycosyltransferase involved in cell wall biosynthesis
VRVLHVITGLAPGGAEQQLRLLLRRQRPAAEVATLTNPGSVARAIRADGTPVHDLGMRGNTDLAALPRLVRLIRAGRYDVVHTHLYRACVYGRVAARLAGVRHVVATEHSLGDRHIEGRRITSGIRRLYLATERLGQTTIAVSAAVGRRLVAWGVPAARVEVIPNGIEADRYRFDPVRRARVRTELGIAPGRFVVGSVGRLVPGKRADLMLHAVRGQPGTTALVVGAGPQRRTLTALARELDVHAVFTGEAGDVPGLLSAMDVLVAPSPEETFGLAVIEALAAGLPVLYVTCPALDELPDGSAPGAYRLPADPEAIQHALATVVRDPPRRLPAPPALDHYDMAGVAARTTAVYRRVTGTTPPRHPSRRSEEELWPPLPRH